MKSMTDVYARLLVDTCMDVGGERLNERIGDVLSLMERRGEGHLARQLPEALNEVYAECSGQQQISLQTAVPSKELVGVVARSLHVHEQDIHRVEQPQLIGGAVVRVGNTIVDASVRGALAQLKKRLVVRK